LMSRNRKALTAAKLEDAILGAFSNVQPSETLDHFLRYVSTWGGSDKFLMLVQYSAKLLVPLLQLRARLRHRAGFTKEATSGAAEGVAKLASMIGTARTVWGIWGLLPIIQWLVSIERKNPSTRRLLTIERLQGWSMLFFYPLDHLSNLISHGITSPSSLPSGPAALSKPSEKDKAPVLDAGKLSMWSCRFWGLYVALQFAHLLEDRKLLIASQRSLAKAKSKGPIYEMDKAELRRRWDAFYHECIANLAYFPMTIHWSLEKGLFGNDVYVNLLGFIAALFSFRSGWKATALPPAPVPPMLPAESATVTIATSSLDQPGYDEALALKPLTGEPELPSV